MRDHRRLLSWMKSVWLPMVPELSAANSHEVMQGRTVVLAILDRTLKDFEQTKQKMKAAALEWLDVRAGEDKAEKQELREKKESKIEQAEEKGDKKAIEKAKGIQVVVKPKKEVGFAWVDGVFWGRWCRGTYGVDVRETGPRIIINEQDVLPDPHNWTDVLGKEILGYQPSRQTNSCNNREYCRNTSGCPCIPTKNQTSFNRWNDWRQSIVHVSHSSDLIHSASSGGYCWWSCLQLYGRDGG